MVRVSTPGLHKGASYAALTESQNKSGGRNHYGRITTRHKGGGSKQHYRVVDFKRDKEGIACRVERIEYDPNRTAHIALLCYVDGERRYIEQVLYDPELKDRAGDAAIVLPIAAE